MSTAPRAPVRLALSGRAVADGSLVPGGVALAVRAHLLSPLRERER